MAARTFNLADLFEVVVDACPDRLALVAGDVRLTYRELDARANKFAHAFIACGIGPGDHVGVYARNRSEWLEAMIGAFKARAVPVNINYRYVADELRYVLDNADIKALVVEADLLDTVDAVDPVPGVLKTLFVLPTDGDGTVSEGFADVVDLEGMRLVDAASEERDFGPRSDTDQYIVYTGGTTGFPKGVQWYAKDVFVSAFGGGNFGGAPISDPEELAAKADKPPLVQMLTTPLMHGNGQWVTWITLLSAGTAVLWTGQRWDPEAILRAVEREGAATLMLVGDAMARPLADELARGGHDASSLKVIGSGGALLSPAVKEQLKSLVPGLYISDGFGASEFGAGSAQNADGRFPLKPNTAVLGDDLRPVKPGETGRMARTGHIPLGYYKDAEKTAATFPVDPDGVRWVVPGDFARLEEDGTVTLLGRGSVCINTGGEKVYPEEVEGVLKAHPAVYDVVVVGVPDARFGERVAAVASVRDGHTVTLAELAAHSRASIAGYKVPRDLVLVDAVPRSPAGKPDYQWAKRVAVEAMTGPVNSGSAP
ncbi:acyl-CoA synthetase [Yinghuangia seranimata]|uniref:acyl-CoA synthetase n=1 Tax=Yinghuangia seranimata TaxID=408067 RepID=UPI00248CCD5A|nr:acyl-CoA synthetase [Yinghuangia seranimata]MDI2132516.1 acyl-CoA synthetase [Yinghuangia seranimata]